MAAYISYDKVQMTNLQESLPREILCTNDTGAYCCTTIVGCNIRKYHGLLVMPIPEIDNELHVLLSSLDETIIQHGAEFNMAYINIRVTIIAPTVINTFARLNGKVFLQQYIM